MLSSSFFCSSFCGCRHPPRDETRERRKSLSLSLSLLLGDSRVFSVVLFSLSRQRQKETTGCEEEELEREARKGKFSSARPLFSLFFFFLVASLASAISIFGQFFFDEFPYNYLAEIDEFSASYIWPK
jgi:hypothetical protein